MYPPPTKEEQERAASGQPAKKFNCGVTAGGSLNSGHALVDAASGAQHGWGLATFVGNAQEPVRAAIGLKARGGSFLYPLSRCGATISRRHDGQPDGVAIARLVRETG